MDKNRREFFRNLGNKTVSAAAAVTIPAASYAADFGAEIKKLSGDFSQKLAKTTEMIGDQVDQLSNRLDAAAMKQAYQQNQLHLIFLLLLISFLIDGGMTLTWLVW